MAARSERPRKPVPHPARTHFCPPATTTSATSYGGLDDAEALDRVDDQEPVADHVADALEVGPVAGAVVDEADGDGGGGGREVVADDLGGHDSLRRLHGDRVERRAGPGRRRAASGMLGYSRAE